MNWQSQLHLWTGFKTIPMTTSFTETIRGREQIAEVCLPLFSDGVFSPEFFSPQFFRWGFPRIRSPGKFVLQGHSCSRQDCFFSIFFPLSPFFPKKTWRREILGNGANDNFPWVFDDFRFMIHTPCSRFFLEKNKEKHIRKKFVPQEFLHDTYSPRIRAPGFPS